MSLAVTDAGQGAGEPLAEMSIAQSEPKNKNFCSNFVSILDLRS